MNRLLPYETGIANKMEHLPVPDMADDIWDNLQAQLNTGFEDMSGNGKEVLQKVTVKPPKIIWWVIGCIVVIIICVLLLKKMRLSPSSPKTSIPEKTGQSLQEEKSKKVPETSQVSNHDSKTVYPVKRIMDSITVIPKAVPSLSIDTDSVDILKASQ